MTINIKAINIILITIITIKITIQVVLSPI
jgi:hypothetical protein